VVLISKRLRARGRAAARVETRSLSSHMRLSKVASPRALAASRRRRRRRYTVVYGIIFFFFILCYITHIIYKHPEITSTIACQVSRNIILLCIFFFFLRSPTAARYNPLYNRAVAVAAVAAEV